MFGDYAKTVEHTILIEMVMNIMNTEKQSNELWTKMLKFVEKSIDKKIIF